MHSASGNSIAPKPQVTTATTVRIAAATRAQINMLIEKFSASRPCQSTKRDSSFLVAQITIGPMKCRKIARR
jgi:hypothetical protein